ncbi:hypothetical protein EON64_08505 [archaeon]|nr:MAG: hypothetical protein EON64_08505 [archaeon]
MHWLSNGTQPNGMIVRLQGFDRGIFGGNFHTHNMLNIFVPGVDVVCFSNGADYVRGVRYVHKQVKESKRMVVLVDSTDLLNKRHLDENKKDERMLSIYPEEEGGYDFDQVIVYLPTPTSPSSSPRKQIVIVTYGNGVPTSLQAQQTLTTLYPTHDVVVIDTPYLSSAPADLLTYLTTHASDIDSVVLADVCKAMPGMPLAKMAVDLHNQGLLGGKGGASSKGKGKGKSKSGSGENMQWRVVGAAPTYNPLGSYVTFLSVDDIVSAVKSMM